MIRRHDSRYFGQPHFEHACSPWMCIAFGCPHSHFIDATAQRPPYRRHVARTPMTQLTYRQAAKRVHRSVRTIHRWRRNGMPMSLDEDGFRVVDEQVLLKWWRARLNNWPPHQWRMRALLNQSEPPEDAPVGSERPRSVGSTQRGLTP